MPRFLEDEREADLPPGVAVGLAWTPVGGAILHIEVSHACPARAACILTGKLGDVMKESAQAALSYAKSRAKELGIAPEMFDEKHDIHIHVPAGRHAQGWPLGRRHPGHGADFGADQHPGVQRCGHDRRDHPARPGCCPSAASRRRSWPPWPPA